MADKVANTATVHRNEAEGRQRLQYRGWAERKESPARRLPRLARDIGLVVVGWGSHATHHNEVCIGVSEPGNGAVGVGPQADQGGVRRQDVPGCTRGRSDGLGQLSLLITELQVLWALTEPGGLAR